MECCHLVQPCAALSTGDGRSGHCSNHVSYAYLIAVHSSILNWLDSTYKDMLDIDWFKHLALIVCHSIHHLVSIALYRETCHSLCQSLCHSLSHSRLTIVRLSSCEPFVSALFESKILSLLMPIKIIMAYNLQNSVRHWQWLCRLCVSALMSAPILTVIAIILLIPHSIVILFTNIHNKNP